MKTYKSIVINGKQVRLHRALMEAYIGRPLQSWELVHHIDGDIHNNDLSNLSITIRSDHMKAHKIGENTRFKPQYIIDKEDLIELYLNQRLPIWKVGKIVGAPYGSVFRALKKHNIIRKKQPCKICSSPSNSTIKDICYQMLPERILKGVIVLTKEQFEDKYIGKIHCGDCLEVMKDWPDNSVPTIITDPPYGLSFMGKKWDYQVPSIEEWQECLRVLKPGGTLLCFAGSRTQHRMACNVEDAGFILKDCIMWLYGSGFPKATDISKQLDKASGVKGEEYIDEDFLRRNPDTGQSKKGIINKGYFDGEQAAIRNKPATPEAQLWNGWKSHGLKPAYEPILVAMKPNDGTYAENALKWGVSGLWIDGGRIRTEDKLSFGSRKLGDGVKYGKCEPTTEGVQNPQGRFPANIILDEEAGAMLDEQSGDRQSGGSAIRKPRQEGQTAAPEKKELLLQDLTQAVLPASSIVPKPARRNATQGVRGWKKKKKGIEPQPTEQGKQARVRKGLQVK